MYKKYSHSHYIMMGLPAIVMKSSDVNPIISIGRCRVIENMYFVLS